MLVIFIHNSHFLPILILVAQVRVIQVAQVSNVRVTIGKHLLEELSIFILRFIKLLYVDRLRSVVSLS
jgi:hypothetical protein